MNVLGELDDITEKLMIKKRCGVRDQPLDFKLHNDKWSKNVLKFLFPKSIHINIYKHIANICLNEWLIYDDNEPDILITYGSLKHGNSYKCRDNVKRNDFDGDGGVLAHAFYPENSKFTEIHLDQDENWYRGTVGIPSGGASLYLDTPT